MILIMIMIFPFFPIFSHFLVIFPFSFSLFFFFYFLFPTSD